MVEAAGPNEDSRRRGKSEAAFRTISEVASDLGLPQHVLRFWETKFIQIRPLKRGGGRRYYRPEDVVLLKRIRGLLYDEGYTIKGVQKLLKQNGGRAPAVEAGPETAPPVVEAAPAVSGPSGLTPAQRAEIETVVEELEALRRLLRGDTA